MVVFLSETRIMLALASTEFKLPCISPVNNTVNTFLKLDSLKNVIYFHAHLYVIGKQFYSYIIIKRIYNIVYIQEAKLSLG